MDLKTLAKVQLELNRMGLLLKELIEFENEENLCVLRRKRKAVNDIYMQRRNEGTFNVLFRKHLSTDEIMFQKYLRLTPKMFYELLSLIENDIKLPPYNRNKKPISPAQQLCLTLRFLATGESQTSLGFQFRISQSYVSKIIRKVIKSIIEKKLKEVIPEPSEESWRNIANKFETRFNFPMCLGAIDGKHVRIQCPANSGALNSIYKSNFSIVLLALVDADYKFIAIDVGSFGKEGDASIFQKSELGKRIKNEQVLPPSAIKGTNIVVPHVFLGDQAFLLKSNVMIPYSKKNVLQEVGNSMATFNIRHTAARKVVENAFGIMNNCWRIFNTPINMDPNSIDNVIVVCCILHNMLRAQKVSITTETELPTINNPSLIPLLPVQHTERENPDGLRVRHKFCSYFASSAKIAFGDE